MLLQLAKGVAAPRLAGVVPLTAQAIRNVGRRYQEDGLDRALYEKQRPEAAEVLDDSQKQRLIAMVCSSPPEGHAVGRYALWRRKPLNASWFRV